MSVVLIAGLITGLLGMFIAVFRAINCRSIEAVRASLIICGIGCVICWIEVVCRMTGN